MAAAMARGWSGAVQAMLFTDSGSGRAKELAAELGGEAVESNAELAERADLVVLAVKPAKLEEAASELGAAGTVISLLGATPLERVAAAFPGSDVVRVMPNVAVEVRRAEPGQCEDIGVVSQDERAQESPGRGIRRRRVDMAAPDPGSAGYRRRRD